MSEGFCSATTCGLNSETITVNGIPVVKGPEYRFGVIHLDFSDFYVLMKLKMGY